MEIIYLKDKNENENLNKFQNKRLSREKIYR
jgi:hypothetical protein